MDVALNSLGLFSDLKDMDVALNSSGLFSDLENMDVALNTSGLFSDLEDMDVALNSSGLFSDLEDMDVGVDSSRALRLLICVVYSAVCAAGLVGNLLVLIFMKVRVERRTSRLNVFVLNLAVTDLQFVLTLPFWAADTALDFSWPFGDAMCRIVLSVTVMNMYASVFFLTAMSLTRYRSMACALNNTAPRGSLSARWQCVFIWTLACVATAPTPMFSTVSDVTGESLCLLRFPGGQSWLALYHIQKILAGFVLPMCIVCVSYTLLIRVIRDRSMKRALPTRQSRVTRSVTVVVLSFFLCWMPNHALTLWSVLVKLNAARFDRAYYVVHTYVFPLTVCLAHANSCLNPVIYCLTRREFRNTLRGWCTRAGHMGRSHGPVTGPVIGPVTRAGHTVSGNTGRS